MSAADVYFVVTADIEGMRAEIVTGTEIKDQEYNDRTFSIDWPLAVQSVFTGSSVWLS